MSRSSYRVIQWATGTVGKIALAHFIDNPAFAVAGVLVTNPEKAGKDAGTLAGRAPIGVAATDDVDAILALDADCVHYAPIVADIDTICRILRAGKNMVSPAGPFFPTDANRTGFARIAAAAKEGGASFHGCGIHPGYIGDIVPMTLARLCDRIDRLEVHEIADKLVSPSVYIEFMGFGLTPDELRSRPNCMANAVDAFGESMAMVATGLGMQPGKVTEEHEIALASRDIPYPGGVIRAGAVAGQHWTWTMPVDGCPLLVYHLWYRLGDDMEPDWRLGESRHRIVFEGSPSFEMTLQASPGADGRRPFLGIDWTALLGCTAVPAVCEAAPGVVTHFDLGVVCPLGLVREAVAISPG